MDSVFYDPPFSDEQRREALYDGELFSFSPRPASMALVQHAIAMVEEGFGDLDPQTAQDHMAVEEYAKLLADLKPRFIHHPRSKELIAALMVEMGCDPEKTYFDVPRLRTSTSGGYLTTGIAYAFHPHRDCWYSAPFCQQNWWMPVYPVQRDNVMAFHPKYWTEPVKNGSHDYNYDEWNRTSRYIAAQQVGVDTRKQPKAEEEVELDPQIRLVTPPGAPILFSGAQFHSSVPNTSGKTRISIDFRTVNIDDVESGRGAPNIDAECTGTTLGDFLRCTDLAHLPDELIARYDTPANAPVG